MDLVETHCHTVVSDGKPTPEEAVRAARARGLAALAVTDHNTFEGSRAAARAARVLGDVIVVFGSEVRTSWGDVVVLCPSDPGGEAPRDPFELREWSLERGCVTIAAHPLNKLHHGIGWKRLRENAGLFDAVEAWNAYTPPILNIPVLLLSRRLGLARTSGSDAHVASMIGVAPSRVEDASSPEAVVESIRRGLVEPSLGVPGPRALVDSLVWSVERRIKALRL